MLVKGVVAFVDRLRWLRCFGRFCSVSVLGKSIQNLHLVGHDFDCRALFAFRACHFLVCNRPSRYTCLPFPGNSPQPSASRPKQTILNHSTLSRGAPSPSFHRSLTARLKVPTGVPFGLNRW